MNQTELDLTAENDFQRHFAVKVLFVSSVEIHNYGGRAQKSVRGLSRGVV